MLDVEWQPEEECVADQFIEEQRKRVLDDTLHVHTYVCTEKKIIQDMQLISRHFRRDSIKIDCV